MTERSSPDIESLIENLLQTSLDYERAEKFEAKHRRQDLEDAKQAIRTALDAAQTERKHSHVMCVGWPTIKRLAAGEAVWFESLECGVVAGSDLHGADIDAMLANAQPSGKEEEFCYWLKGYLRAIKGRDELDAREANVVRNKLNEMLDGASPQSEAGK